MYPEAFPASKQYQPLNESIVDQIRQAVGEDALISDPERMQPFGQDASELSAAPELVVEVTEAAQIQALLRLANQHHFPVTPRGLGTGLAGGAVPVYGGVVLSLARMNRILKVDERNFLALVEPGVITLDLQRAALEKGLFYPPDPASLDTCSIGGNAATNAGGPSCVKYGSTRDYVLGLEAVLPNGALIRAGVLTRKGVVGYDLAHLLVGSEGTLAVITKLFLKLIPRPPAVTTLVAMFVDLVAAMRAVRAILLGGHVPCALEFLDCHCLRLVGDLLPFAGAREAGAFLLLEVDGAADVIQRQVEAVGAICLENEAVEVLLAPDAEKRARMWQVRKQVSLRIEEQAVIYIPEDVVLPLALIADFVDKLADLEQRYQMTIYAFGHAGDGNIHLNIVSTNLEDRQRVEEGIEEILGLVLRMGGTISGEHGIGIAKKRFLPLELSEESIQLQRAIKRVFDPNYILNPGKVFHSLEGMDRCCPV
ncbi:MAG: FAD-binding protein [Deltaproteobacteria bacterium]|nr:FAD-binding protein [Deltaproteobacteria bacterium]MBW2072385.1 FAD-binding protein [Deltaproteobacteria bacterium]